MIMKRRNLYIGVALAILSITACKPTLDEFTPSAGTKADFSKYIAIGNSLSAGFADGGLYLEGQKWLSLYSSQSNFKKWVEENLNLHF